MDAGQRLAQAQFLNTLLSALTPQGHDQRRRVRCRVRLGLRETAAGIAVERLRRARTSWPTPVAGLDRPRPRVRLGPASACGPDTHVIYIGDGILTTGDADPVALAKRLRRHLRGEGQAVYLPCRDHGQQLRGRACCRRSRRWAAVPCGTSRASMVRQAVALELLGEMTSAAAARSQGRVQRVAHGPGLSRAFAEPGGGVAADPARPIPAGGTRQTGEVIVTGTRAGKPVRFSTKVALADAEKGNSFIPRLWADMHLDHLLEQGGSPAIQEEIIALSEEYNILTPYTSLLVLESDADRERFKVKSRFRMRDGEKFFAQGRDNANYELKQQQMKRAGDWRLGLHRRVLQQFAGLGRDPRWLQGQEDRASQA